MVNKVFTGIGSRTTPKDIQEIMEVIAMDLCDSGWTLRSGGAAGADSAFERGCDTVKGKKEIYLPWNNFNSNPSPLFKPPMEAYYLALEHHPYPKWLEQSKHVSKLMARNSQQILGQDLLIPTQLVVCWTQDGAETETTTATGGTGQAIRIAIAYDIPVFNLKNSGAVERLLEFIAEVENVNKG